MSRARAAAALACIAPLAGCQEEPKFSLEAWSTIETREVNGQRDEVLRSAAAVILDDGYYFVASDHAAGLIAGDRVPGQFQSSYQRSGGMGHRDFATDRIAVWVRQTETERTECRVQVLADGMRVADEKRVTEFWARVERRMMAGDAPVPAQGAAR